jgi:hypothetical protein
VKESVACEMSLLRYRSGHSVQQHISMSALLVPHSPAHLVRALLSRKTTCSDVQPALYCNKRARNGIILSACVFSQHTGIQSAFALTCARALDVAIPLNQVLESRKRNELKRKHVL